MGFVFCEQHDNKSGKKIESLRKPFLISKNGKIARIKLSKEKELMI